MKKKLVALLTASTLATVALSGCGSSSDDSADSSEEETEEAEETEEEAAEEETEEEEEAEEETEEESEEETADEDTAEEDTLITVAASATPHAEILEVAADVLAEEGYELEVTIFEDYVQPNNVVDSGEIDCNYFQHVNYLESFNEENGTNLAIAENGRIHYEPFGIYGGTKTSLDEIEEGDAIAVPNDTTNEARALLLLEQEGLITLAEGVGVTATVNDIEENPYNLEIVEVEAAQVAKQLPSVAFGVINGNYALENGLNVSTDAIAVESAEGDAIQQYVNVIAVQEGNEELPKIQALVEALHSDTVVDFITDNYEGAVVAYEGEQ